MAQDGGSPAVLDSGPPHAEAGRAPLHGPAWLSSSVGSRLVWSQGGPRGLLQSEEPSRRQCVQRPGLPLSARAGQCSSHRGQNQQRDDKRPHSRLTCGQLQESCGAAGRGARGRPAYRVVCGTGPCCSRLAGMEAGRDGGSGGRGRLGVWLRAGARGEHTSLAWG